ncbi:amidohydrolase family protein [Streptomyces calidiresistens]|uniref:Amidohydrolase family protein n=1 Tax=Streptomyces calidiresistens TaxID=1485586 RepID=A0A7W3XVH8_9ACTN|nr:amidohydrolase family protein [Streptomyces calidiresistens]MBB0228833.1 amidohydrolase family protein [Streptomyces calidiresistens]
MSALLIRGGVLYPADAAARVVPGGAVLIEDRKVVAAGPLAEVEAAITPRRRAGLRTIEADDRMILPGFVNAHWHEMFAMRFPFKGALRPASDRDDRPVFMAMGGDVPQISVAFDTFHDHIDRLTPDEALAIARYSMWTQLRSGVTALGDVGSLNQPRALAQAARDLGMRCTVSTWAADAVCAPGDGHHTRTRDTDLELQRIEELLKECAADPGGLVRAWPTAVYGTNMTDELAFGLAELTARYDVPFATHVGALRHEAEVMLAYYGATPVRRFAEAGLLSERFMAVHCGFADPGERALLIDAGAHISHSPAKYGQTGESTISETRMIPEFRRAGLDVSVSTDGAALPVGGMPEAMRAVWQHYNEMYADPTEVLPTDALAMATRLPARGLDLGEHIGSLEPGKQADLLLVRTDDWRYLLNPRPLEGFLSLGGSMDIDTVIVAGRILIEDGHSTRLDEEVLEAEYLEALSSFTVRCLGVPAETVRARLARRAETLHRRRRAVAAQRNGRRQSS